MIRVLSDAGTTDESTDVAIIGAGIAGLITAQRLRRCGLKVVVIEAGKAEPKGGSEGLPAPIFKRSLLGSGAAGRASGVGGTSQLWGGALLPMQREDIEDDTAGWGIGWPITQDELQPYLLEAEDLFGLLPGSYDDPPRDAVWRERRAKWPRFERRNVAALIKRPWTHDPGFRVWAEAPVTKIVYDQGGRARAVIATGEDGSKLTVAAREFVIAAGTVESTRLMLLFDRIGEGRLGSQSGVLGRYLTDHLVEYYADIDPIDRRALGKLATFTFERGGMRNLRFALDREVRVAERLGGGFGAVLAISDGNGPFDALRDVYRGFQRGAKPTVHDVAKLARGAPWIAGAAWQRVVRRRLAVPPNASFALNVGIEQVPKASNRIFLDGDTSDRNKGPRVIINWSPGADDVENFLRCGAVIGAAWQRAGLDRAGRLVPRAKAVDEILGSRGTSHASGTIRMGADAASGVVDRHLAAFGCPNLYVVSSAVFPTAGSSNPTLTIAALALRLGDRLAKPDRAR